MIYTTRALSVRIALAIITVVPGVVLSGCDEAEPTRICDSTGLGCPRGFLCIEGQCLERQECDVEDDCEHPAEYCDDTFSICLVRAGFSNSCLTSQDCTNTELCVLGDCLETVDLRSCTGPEDCGDLETCDPRQFRCIPNADCRLSDDFPEITCWDPSICDEATGTCVLPCQEECTLLTEADDCEPGLRCNQSCQCVQCRSDNDCGPGLTCAARTGICVDRNRCLSDSDCLDDGLVCDLGLAICRPPAQACQNNTDCASDETCDEVSGTCLPIGGVCEDDRLEDNDSLSDPTFVPNSDDPGVQTFEDLVLCLDDEDIFDIELEASEFLNMGITVERANADIEVLVTRRADGLLAARFDVEGGTSSELSFQALTADHYAITLSTRTRFSEYAMTFSTTPGEACVDDAFDTDAGRNDSRLTATVLDDITEAGASLCQQDIDHYRFNLESNTGAVVTITSNDVLNLGLTAAEDASQNIGRMIPFSGGAYLYFSSRLGGSYILAVSTAQAVQNASYDISWTSADFLFECSELDAEPNDTEDTALELSSDGTALAGLACFEDVDLYHISVADYESLDLDIVFDRHLSQPLVEVREDDVLLNTQPLIFFDGRWHHRMLLRGDTDRSYHIRIDNQEPRIAAYEISGRVYVSQSCLLDPLEPNETSAEASPIDLETPEDIESILCAQDEDYYRLTLVDLGTLNIRALFSQLDGDIDIELLSHSGNILAQSSSVTDNEELSFTVPASGTYFLRVYSQARIDAVGYLLQASFTQR